MRRQQPLTWLLVSLCALGALAAWYQVSHRPLQQQGARAKVWFPLQFPSTWVQRVARSKARASQPHPAQPGNVTKRSLPTSLHPRAGDAMAPAAAQGLSSLCNASEEHIPCILHQSWKTRDVPAKYHAWMQSWRRNHPHWQYRLWTDDDNRALIKEHFGWFLETYDGYPRNIMRADAVRYFYMLHYGGVYLDLDFDSIRPLDGLLAGRHVVLASMGRDPTFDNSVPNAFLAGPPGHSFWRHLVRILARRASAYERQHTMAVEATTGPGLLFRALRKYRAKDAARAEREVTVLPPGCLYPFDWADHSPGTEDSHRLCWTHSEHFNETACKALFPDAYAITYWDHSWGDNRRAR